MTVTEAVERRRSTPSFDPTFQIDRQTLSRLMSQACLAPSALNLQPWRFVVCDTTAAKERLYEACFQQEKVRQAGTVVVVFGDLLHHLNAPQIAAGNVSPEVDDERQWVSLANQAYGDPARARDEAFRGGSLWAMTFSLLAVEAGWDTSLIGGFDSVKLPEALGIPDRYIPVVIVAIGRASGDRIPRPRRFVVEELLLAPRPE